MEDDLRWAASGFRASELDNPRLEARLLLAHVLGETSARVAAGVYAEPDAEQRDRFRALVRQRAARTPLAYLLGYKEFYGLKFAVGPGVLIPRPETELLVEFGLEHLPPADEGLFVDAGAGSGCIAISVLAARPSARAVALDVSPDCLRLARINACCHNVAQRCQVVRGSMLTGIASRSASLILSNPPYVPDGQVSELQTEVACFEPRMALAGGADGLQYHRQLADEALRVLADNGWLAVEVGHGQSDCVAELFAAAGLARVEVREDLARIGRLVAGQQRPGTTQEPLSGM